MGLSAAPSLIVPRDEETCTSNAQPESNKAILQHFDLAEAQSSGGLGENDPARRRAAIDQIYTEDSLFYDPKGVGVYRGRDEIDRIAGAIRATHPDFRYQPIAEPEELGNGGCIRWVSGRPGDAAAYAGTDFIIAQDGLIAALYLFFDKL